MDSAARQTACGRRPGVELLLNWIFQTRDWNEELQTTRELPRKNLPERLLRERAIFKVLPAGLSARFSDVPLNRSGPFASCQLIFIVISS